MAVLPSNYALGMRDLPTARVTPVSALGASAIAGPQGAAPVSRVAPASALGSSAIAGPQGANPAPRVAPASALYGGTGYRPSGFEASTYGQGAQQARQFADRNRSAAFSSAERSGREMAARMGGSAAMAQRIQERAMAPVREYGLQLNQQVAQAEQAAREQFGTEQRQDRLRADERVLEYLRGLEDPTAYLELMSKTTGPSAVGVSEAYSGMLDPTTGRLQGRYTPTASTQAQQAADETFESLGLEGVVSALGLPPGTDEGSARAALAAQLGEALTSETRGLLETSALSTRLKGGVSGGIFDSSQLITPSGAVNTQAAKEAIQMAASGMAGTVIASPEKNDLLPAGQVYRSKGGELRISLGVDSEGYYRYADADGAIKKRKVNWDFFPGVRYGASPNYEGESPYYG